MLKENVVSINLGTNFSLFGHNEKTNWLITSKNRALQDIGTTVSRVLFK